MPRTPNVKIIEWGTPPDPEPTGWEAVAAELNRKPGAWANVGEMTPATARKIGTERLPEADGYETRTITTKDPRKVAVWVRRAPAAAADAGTVIGTIDVDAAAEAAAEAAGPGASGRTRVKRGAVV